MKTRTLIVTIATLALALTLALSTAVADADRPAPRPEPGPEDVEVIELPEEGVRCFLFQVEWDPQYNGSRAGMSCLPTSELRGDKGDSGASDE